MHFDDHLKNRGISRLRRVGIDTLQLNIGLQCNLACHHCHVDSGPKRKERLDRRAIGRVLELLESNPAIETLDITGGAPEMHPDFRFLVRGARALDRRVIDRCNLTILLEPDQRGMADFLADQRVEIVASLPCHGLENVERQRGRGVFDGSIRALQILNGLGYGKPDSGLVLDLVYNPVGPFLPASQASLEADYRKELGWGFGIVFNRLLTITNMPIKRFAHELEREGQFETYMGLLIDNFNADNIPDLMCPANVGRSSTSMTSARSCRNESRHRRIVSDARRVRDRVAMGRSVRRQDRMTWPLGGFDYPKISRSWPRISAPT